MKKLITLAKKLLIITVGASLLFGCASYKDAKNEIQKTRQQIDNVQDMDNTSAPAAINLSGYYTDKTPVEISNDPAWLNHSISLQAKNLPLNVLMQRLLRTTKMVASYDGSTQPDMPVDINYTGSIKGALKYISAKTGLHYTIHNLNLRWSAFMTKTFNVSFMPGSSSYAVGQLSGGGAGAGGAGGGEQEGMSQNMILNDQQHSDLSAAELSVWKDLKKTLEQLKSEKGKVVISESTTTVTVHDYPANVATISKYIQHINDILSQEVAIKVEILDVQLNKKFQFGIDWTVASKMTLGNKTIPLGLATKGFEAIGGEASTAGASAFTFGGSNQSIIHALNTQGKVSVVTQPKVVTMNNQMASIRITQDQGYLKSIATVITGNGNTSNVQTTLTPGNITDGLTLYILPKIQKDKVILQISSTLATLVKIEKISSAPSEKDDAGGNYNAIQAPTVTQKQFNQRSAVRSGQTLVIAGYKSLHNETKGAGIIEPLGGKSSLTENRETVVLITPTILNRAATQ